MKRSGITDNCRRDKNISTAFASFMTKTIAEFGMERKGRLSSHLSFYCELYNGVVKSLQQKFKLPGKLSWSKVKREASRRRNRLRRTEFQKAEVCCAYLKQFAACHAALTWNVCLRLLKESSAIQDVLRKREICIVGIGGPGDDLIGLCCAVSSCLSPRQTLSLTVVGLTPAWEDVLNEVLSESCRCYYPELSSLIWNNRIATKFSCDDDFSSQQASKTVESADVLTMVKLSLMISREKRQQIFQNILQWMKPGAVFIYIDHGAYQVRDAAVQRTDMDILLYSSFVGIAFGDDERKGLCAHSNCEVCVVRKRTIPGARS